MLGPRGGRAWLLVPALILGVGCSPPRPSGASDNSLRAVLSADPISLSFIGKSDGNSEILAGLVTDSLVKYDESLNLVPRVAESWEVSADGLTVLFRLRRGVTWHDGQPVTARDVVFTIGEVRKPQNESRTFISQFEDLESIEAVDPYTLRARYSKRYADFLEAWRIPLLPEHILAGQPDLLTSPFARRPMGCGPFRFVRWDPGREIVLEANPTYWDGPPKISRLIFRILPNERTGYQALLKGDVDLMAVTSDFWRDAQASPKAARLARFTYTPLRVWYIGWNLDGTNPFFADPRTRRAMTLALDRERFAARVIGGLARPALGTYPPDADPSLTPWPFDPEEAARLLDEAGWKDTDGDGVRDRNGVPFSFVMSLPAAYQDLPDRIASWVQQSLSEVGVRMQIEKLEWRAFQERRKNHRFQAAMANWTFTPVLDQFELYHSSSRDAGMNYGGFADSDVDRMVEEGRGTFDPLRRAEIYGKLRGRVHELEPVSFLFHFTVPVLYDVELEGLRPNPLGLWLTVPGPRAWRWAGVSGTS